MFRIPDNQRVTITRRVWLPKGWRVEVGFGNGYTGVKSVLEIIDPEYDKAEYDALSNPKKRALYAKQILPALAK